MENKKWEGATLADYLKVAGNANFDEGIVRQDYSISIDGAYIGGPCAVLDQYEDMEIKAIKRQDGKDIVDLKLAMYEIFPIREGMRAYHTGDIVEAFKAFKQYEKACFIGRWHHEKGCYVAIWKKGMSMDDFSKNLLNGNGKLFEDKVPPADIINNLGIIADIMEARK